MRRHYGCDFVYGHIVQRDRHLIISAGLGTTHAPVRFMRPPEVVELTIRGGGAAVLSTLKVSLGRRLRPAIHGGPRLILVLPERSHKV